MIFYRRYTSEKVRSQWRDLGEPVLRPFAFVAVLRPRRPLLSIFFFSCITYFFYYLHIPGLSTVAYTPLLCSFLQRQVLVPDIVMLQAKTDYNIVDGHYPPFGFGGDDAIELGSPWSKKKKKKANVGQSL